MAANPTETSTTSLAALRSATQPREAQLPTVRAGFSDLAGFELAQRAAKALATSTLVPQQYQGNIPNALIALELAQRIGASPLMVMQNLYIVHGRPSWSSQFLIAAVNQCGRFTALQYEWSGAQNTDAWTCRAWAKDKATGERVQGPAVSIAMAKKEGWYSKTGSKWQSIPELMLMYRAATFFARTNAPELTMGLSTTEEAHEIIDVQETEPGRFETTTEEVKTGSEQPAVPPTEAAVESEPQKPRGKREKPVEQSQGAAGGSPYTDEVKALYDIDNAPDRDAANVIADLCRGTPFYPKVAEAYNRRWAEVVG